MGKDQAASPMPQSFTMKAYQHLLEATATQRELGCDSLTDTTTTVRCFLITQLGMRRFLGTRLEKYAREPAAGWTVEFAFGEHLVYLENPDRSLSDTLQSILEECYYRRHSWPTGVRKDDTFIKL